jgi:hypothetical protein
VTAEASAAVVLSESECSTSTRCGAKSAERQHPPALPGVLVVVLTVTPAVIQARDVRRQDPVRRFTRQQRLEGMARASGQFVS